MTGRSGRGPSSTAVVASGSPQSTSAKPWAWSKRTSVSATTNRLSGRGGAGRRQRHGWLERGGVVVGEVADDRLGARLCFFERDELRAAADERVAAEPAVLDRLQQERCLALLAQPQVRPERGDEVGGDDGCRVHELLQKEKDLPAGRSRERSGYGRRVSRRSRLARSATPSFDEVGKVMHGEYGPVGHRVKSVSDTVSC